MSSLAVARGALALAALLIALPSFAQPYPNRPITVVVPFPPGASNDAVARITSEELSKVLGQPVVIENRSGAGGTIGIVSVANAVPDGYTLLITVNGPVSMNQFVQKDFPLDPKTAFTPITLIAETTLLLAVNASVPAANVAELVAYAKKNPGKLSYGSAGVGSGHQLAGELLKKKAGINVIHIPYRGSGPAIQDLIARNIPISFGTPPAVLPQVAAGSIRMLAVSEEKRYGPLPDVPTIAETVPGVAIPTTWIGLLGPAGLPKPMVDKLNAAMLTTLENPDVIANLKLQGLVVVGKGPQVLNQRIKGEIASLRRIVAEIGIQPE